MKNDPVSNVQWVHSSKIVANSYNPNSVAKPEMDLLRLSIESDGYTQPIVVWEKDGRYEIVDGFHRAKIGMEDGHTKDRLKGFLPIVVINQDRADKKDRISSTIRHNRARGKHDITVMSEIVQELKQRNWANSRICKELGMDEDEVIRLLQITGLTEMFENYKYSEAWEYET